jgi:hypothetical protein
MNKYEFALKVVKANINDSNVIPELTELVELHKPKKVIEDTNGVKRCPNCKKYADDVVNGYQFEYPHCKYCGQALNWSK